MSRSELLHPHGELTGNDVMIDILDDNRRRLKRAMTKIDDTCLHWQPDPEANNIAVTLWHMGRLLDVFFTRQTRGKPAGDECWINSGWAERTDYDPRGIGKNGWGSVNGYTLEEVTAIPRFTKEQLLGYMDEVYDSVKSYIQVTPMLKLKHAAAGFEGQYTKYQVIMMVVMDNARHLGEIVTLKVMWERVHLS